MPTPEEIVRGIAQAAADAYDGSHDERYSLDGEAHKAGLKRESGDVILDSRTMDGFNVTFPGNHLCVHYHGEVQLKEIHDNNFENDINQRFGGIVKYLKKEYKKNTDNSLSLTKEGEPQIRVQNLSRRRSFVQAVQYYKIGGMDGVEALGEGTPDDRLDDAIKKWLAIGKDSYPGAKKPRNITRKND